MTIKEEALGHVVEGEEPGATNALHKFILLDYALQYAAQDWKVLPCIEHDSTGKPKAPYTPHGFKDATTNSDQIRDWWRQWPRALIGLVPPSDVVVLDLDRPTAMRDLERLNQGALPATLTAKTGRGHHLYYRLDLSRPEATQGPIRASDGQVIRGVDVRLGSRGYVIAPCSTHPKTGTTYQWAYPTTKRARIPNLNDAITQLPEHLEDALSRRTHQTHTQPQGEGARGRGDSVEGLLATVRQAPKGTRNNCLFWAACCMCRNTLTGRFVDWRALEDAALDAGLSAGRIRATIQSARNTYRLDGAA